MLEIIIGIIVLPFVVSFAIMLIATAIFTFGEAIKYITRKDKDE